MNEKDEYNMSTELSISDLREKMIDLQITKTKSSIRYPFELTIEQSETKLPKGMDLKNIKRIERLKKPFKNFMHVPSDVLNLPFSAILQQPWQVYLKLSLLSLFMLIAPIISFSLAVYDSTQGRGFIFAILIVFLVLGSLGSLFYFKFTHWAIFRIMNRQKYPWIEEPLKEDYEEYYTKPLKNQPRLAQLMAIIISLAITGATLVAMINNVGTDVIGLIFAFILSLVTFVSLTGIFYLMIVSSLFIRNNTRAYSNIMNLIQKKTKGYVFGYESILSKQNYEITWILGNSPGHSIREFEYIPLTGFAVSAVSTLSIVLISVISIFESFGINPNYGLIPGGNDIILMTFVVTFILAVLISLISVMWPMFPLGYVMWRFRGKALNELDTYLFDELTKVSLGEEREVKSETQVIFFLRSYLSSLKSAPISPLKIIQMLMLIFSYFFGIAYQLIQMDIAN
jgi:hypothetical protein